MKTISSSILSTWPSKVVILNLQKKIFISLIFYLKVRKYDKWNRWNSYCSICK